jgi:hypothetical protein
LLFITQAEFKCIRLIVSLVPFSPFPVHHWFQEETPDAKLQIRIFTKKAFQRSSATGNSSSGEIITLDNTKKTKSTQKTQKK